MDRAPSRLHAFRAALTATPYRRDQLDDLIALQLGPVRHTLVPPPTGTLGNRSPDSQTPEPVLHVHPTGYRYAGDADTRPQVVRLRAANVPAGLDANRPTYTAGHLRAHGTVSSAAHGVVRVQLEYYASGKTTTLERFATISNGAWSLDTALTADAYLPSRSPIRTASTRDSQRSLNSSQCTVPS